MLKLDNKRAEAGLADFDATSLGKDGFLLARDHIEREGAIVMRNLVTPDIAAALKTALIRALAEDAEAHGTEYRFYGMVHALMSRGQPFLDLLSTPALLRICRTVLGHGCIVHAYNSSSMPPSASNYSRSIHVDCPRLIPGYITNLGVTLALDPFTSQNGGMEIVPDSFQVREQLSEEAFAAKSVRPALNIGDAIIFNARCWHRGGINHTENWRHAVTLNLCRSYMRQQFDYPRMLAPQHVSGLSEDVRQFLGYHVRTPVSMAEFLMPPETRPHRPGQE
ncbi:phytanoyl-CoA dioxygenase family protein [Dongia sp.]|uniref:phytanoyl-CoA dioxygenase family protein n=1 Tax=Dongia sp. TaxID=1977262 RepID=UPI0035B3F9F7